MKTLKTISAIVSLFIVLTLTTQTTNAAYPPASNAKQLNDIQKVIDHEIDFPPQAAKSNITGIVKAQLKVNNQGRIDVEGINGHPELTRYVETQLKNVVFNDLSLTNKTFIAKFDFRN